MDLAKAFEKVQLNVVWKLTMYFDFPQRVLRVLCSCLAHERKVIFEKNFSEPVTITSILQGSIWSVLLFEDVHAGCCEMYLFDFPIEASASG